MNKVLKTVLFFVTLFLRLTNGFAATNSDTAQNLTVVHHLFIENGLPSNHVHDVLQDHQGYLWIMTNMGLSKYDGQNLQPIILPVHLRHLEGRIKLLEYAENQIWIVRCADLVDRNEFPISEGTLIIYDKSSKQFCKFSDLYPNLPFDLKKVSYINTQSDGFLICTLDGELFQFKEGQFKLLYQKKGEALYHATSIAEHEYWLKTSKKLLQLKNDSIQIWKTISPVHRHLITTSKNEVYFALVSILDDTNQLNIYPSAENAQIETNKPISKMAYLGGRLYYCTNNIIFYYEKGSKITLDLRTALEIDVFSINGMKLLADGKLAVYGINGGVAILTRQQQHFERIQNKKRVISTRAFLPLKDSLFFINSYAGQAIVNTHRKQIIPIKKTLFPNGESVPFFGYDLTRTANGKIWSSINHISIALQDTANLQKIERLYPIVHPKQLAAKTRNLYVDASSDSLWIGTTSGLFYFDKVLDSFLLYQNGRFANLLSETTIHNMRVYGDSLWICTDIGIFVKTTKNGISTYLSALDYSINDLYVESNNRFWLATRKNGVLLWDLEEGLLNKFDQTNGLSNNNVTCIYPDALGNLWIPSFHGLNYLDTKFLSIQSFFESSGIAHNEFNNSSHLLTSDSLLYLGGVNGITIVDTKYGTYDFATKNNTPFFAKRLILYDKKNQEIDTIEITDTSIIQIPAAIKGLVLEFDFLDFTGDKNTDILYKVENLDDRWIPRKNDQLELVAPPPGQYTIHLKAKNSNGKWSSNEITIRINVQKPIYFNWWFIILSVLALGSLSYGFLQLLFYQSKKEKNRLEREVQKRTQKIEEDKRIIAHQLKTIQEVQESKEKIYSIIGHDLRSPLSGLRNLTQKIDYLAANDRLQELKTLTQQFDKSIENVQQLLDQLLVWTQLEQGKYQIEPNIINLTTVIEETVELYNPLIRKKALQLILETQPKAEVFADARSLSTVVRNLIDNAIKHTPAKGFIKIKVHGSQVSITNQGGKMPQNLINYLEASNGKIKAPNKGLGLQICRELVSLNKGKIKVKNNPLDTTSIHIKFTYH